MTLRFRTIADPDGWAESLRLKGDWQIFEIGDGVHEGFGEASHSNDDERCKQAAAKLFAEHYASGFALSLDNLARKEREIAALAPDFVTATAFSGLNQALYDLLAKREQVPVWQLFRSDRRRSTGLPLYTTINRALRTRSAEEYAAIVGELQAQGFKTFKCAPFEAVDNAERAVEKAAAGLATLARLRERFPDLALRVDFHERFQPQDFFAIVPELERLKLDWIEEPFAVGPAYDELRSHTRLQDLRRRAVLGSAAVRGDHRAPLVRRHHAGREARRRLRPAARRAEDGRRPHRDLAAQSVGPDLDGGEPARGGRLPRARALARVFVPAAKHAPHDGRAHRQRRARARRRARLGRRAAPQ